jgi:hypothetical protein
VENPDTWGAAEKIVSKVYGDWADEKGRLMAAKQRGEDVHPIIGLSLARRITDALRDARLLVAPSPLAEMDVQLDELVGVAVDLMSSQQAMPDDDSLRDLALIVREAYALGKEEAKNA